MKYTLVNQGTKNSIRLQGIGVVLAQPAQEIKAGDCLMWNFGSVYVVNEILSETSKTIVISTSPVGSETVYEQRFNKDRLVCILTKELKDLNEAELFLKYDELLEDEFREHQMDASGDCGELIEAKYKKDFEKFNVEFKRRDLLSVINPEFPY